MFKAEEMLRYAMSLPVAPTIAGMDSLAVLRQNLRVARGFTPMTPTEMRAVRDRCAAVAGDGRFEFYKVSLRFDNPQARLPHAFPLVIGAERRAGRRPRQPPQVAAADQLADPPVVRPQHLSRRGDQLHALSLRARDRERYRVGNPSRLDRGEHPTRVDHVVIRGE